MNTTPQIPLLVHVPHRLVDHDLARADGGGLDGAEPTGTHTRQDVLGVALGDPAVRARYEAKMQRTKASGAKDDRPQLAACLKGLRTGDTPVVWKLDRLGRDLRHLVNIVHDLTECGIGLRVLTGQGAAIDTTRQTRFRNRRRLAEYEVAALLSTKERSSLSGPKRVLLPLARVTEWAVPRSR